MTDRRHRGDMDVFAEAALPLYYDTEGQVIYDARRRRLLDIRGWGWMQYFPVPEKGQDAFAFRVVELLTAEIKRVQGQ